MKLDLKKDNLAEFGSRMRSCRRRIGLTQVDLSNRTGLQSTAISHFENGRRYPSVGNLHKISEGLSVSIAWLCGQDEETKFTVNDDLDRLVRRFNLMTTSDQQKILEISEIFSRRHLT